MVSLLCFQGRKRRTSLSLCLLCLSTLGLADNDKNIEEPMVHHPHKFHDIFGNLWDTIQNQLHQAQQQIGASQDQQDISPSKHRSPVRAATRRRTLYAHALQQHYRQELEENLNKTIDRDVRNQTAQAYQDLFDFYFQEDSEHADNRHHPDRTTSLHAALPPLPPSRQLSNLQLIRNVFQHAYDSYMYNAWPAGEVRPISCQPNIFDLIELPALTVIDALDTLIIMENFTEFARATERLRLLNQTQPLVAVDQPVSVFETTIRVLGGFLSAHQLAEAFLKQKVPQSEVWNAQREIQWGDEEDNVCSAAEGPLSADEDCDSANRSLPDCVKSTSADDSSSKTTNNATYWEYDGFYLQLAQDLGYRLLPAFDTKTGIPYGTVNLIHGVPLGETTVASLAGGGTLVLEFELLSRLSGDDNFGKAAKLAARALWRKRSQLQLLGKHIDIQRGVWTETVSGIGSNSDSYLEYLVKAYVLFPKEDDFWVMVQSVYEGIHHDVRMGEWYVDVEMNQGQRHGSRRVLESLMAFYPGMQVLLGEVTPAARTLNSFFMVREFLGFLPERFHFGSWTVDAGLPGASKHPLRPELLESCYLLHRATKDPKAGTSSSTGWLWATDFALHKIESATRAKCGYASVKDLRPGTSGSVDGSNEGVKLYDDMPSFFLSETLKYLYLTFDDNNLLHQDSDHEWIFTTEAHPIHYAPKVKPKRKDGEEHFEEEIDMLKSMLRDKLDGKMPRARDLSTKTDLRNEKWTDAIDHDSYHLDIRSFQSHVRQERATRQRRRDGPPDIFGGYNLIEPFVHSHHVHLDTFNETRSKSNVAHLAFSDLGMGSGSHLRKACPNIYSSDLLWMHALNGGAVDYSDIYLSTLSDDVLNRPIDFSFLGAADALGLLGTGLYLGKREAEEGCPLEAFNETTADDGTSAAPDAKSRLTTGELIEIDSDFGSFEISSFANGAGFYVHHVDSGEAIVTTFFSGEEGDPSSSFLMCYATIPDRDTLVDDDEEDVASSLPLMNDRDFVERENRPRDETRSDKSVSSERSLVIADFAGNSFACEIEVLETSEDAKERVLARYPCAHGLFGQTRMSSLRSTEGLTVEATLVPPTEGDEHGCEPRLMNQCTLEGDDESSFLAGTKPRSVADSSSCSNDEVIPIVRRGLCSFYTKSINQLPAPALIVVNEEEDELFVMSHSPGEETGDVPPVTVLVTGEDGEELVSTAQGGAIARITIRRQEVPKNESGGVDTDEILHWPVVRGAPNLLYLFGRGGWGVQAAQNQGEWQLHLFQHSGDQSNE